MLKLHVGCGTVYFPDWVNIDLHGSNADTILDLRGPLPYGNETVDFIYSEHFIEHLTVQEGLSLMRECYRVLKPGGVARIATPDLDYLMFRYFFFWKRRSWIKKYGYEWIQTKAELMNIAFRDWGHQYLYNREELVRRLREAGFDKCFLKRRNKSAYLELMNRESRKESRLVIEAVK